jgi:NAD(P)-dependent dehydrogenase (short-subunit alcohol dehydrogenase family)
MELDLADRTVLVTGASGGIGRGLVQAFTAEGANVVLASRDETKSHEVAASSQGPGETLVVRSDVTHPESVAALLAATKERFGPVDVLVNNAGGVAHPRPMIEKPIEEMRWEIDLNVWGVLHCTLAAGRDMLERGRGAIVNITSNSALTGEAGNFVANYAGTKGYVMSFSKALAYEWGPRGVRVNCIAPGWIVPWKQDDVGEGSFWKKYGYEFFGTPDAMAAQAQSGELFNASRQPIPRLGRPEDIAWLAAFLASERAAHITGQLVSVSGGAVMF